MFRRVDVTLWKMVLQSMASQIWSSSIILLFEFCWVKINQKYNYSCQIECTECRHESTLTCICTLTFSKHPDYMHVAVSGTLTYISLCTNLRNYKITPQLVWPWNVRCNPIGGAIVIFRIHAETPQTNEEDICRLAFEGRMEVEYFHFLMSWTLKIDHFLFYF